MKVPSTRGHERRRFDFEPFHAPRRFGAQNAVEAELDKRGGKNFGPPNGNKMTFFIDDMSMPEARSRRPTSVPSLPYDSCPSHDDLISRPFAGHDHSEKTEGHGNGHGRP